MKAGHWYTADIRSLIVRIFACLAIASGMCYPSSSLAKVEDFSGTWLLEDRSSVSGNDIANGVPEEITVTHTGSMLTLSRLSAGDKGALVGV
jgi:hypothetical protein